jgi:NAD(P)-dependent dehydrogenase (short-subunit alcohol dehydrogenase family)
MNKLNDRVIIVTGAGRGIGAAVAKLAAAEGALVVVNDPGVSVDGTGAQAGPAQTICDEITAAGGTAVAHLADVSDPEQANDLIQAAIREFGRLDVLANIAGILRDKMIFNLNDQDWQAVLDVHLTGTFNTSRAAAQYWRSKREGGYRLINTTSIAGLHGSPNQPNYAAAKLGIVGLTYSCANGLRAYGVTANAVAPGAITRMFGTIPGNSGVDAMTPENIAPTYAYLASVESGWLSGHVIGAHGTDIELFNRPQAIRQIAVPGPTLDLEDVFALFEKTFRPAVDNVVNYYEAAAGTESKMGPR